MSADCLSKRKKITESLVSLINRLQFGSCTVLTRSPGRKRERKREGESSHLLSTVSLTSAHQPEWLSLRWLPIHTRDKCTRLSFSSGATSLTITENFASFVFPFQNFTKLCCCLRGGLGSTLLRGDGRICLRFHAFQRRETLTKELSTEHRSTGTLRVRTEGGFERNCNARLAERAAATQLCEESGGSAAALEYAARPAPSPLVGGPRRSLARGPPLARLRPTGSHSRQPQLRQELLLPLTLSTSLLWIAGKLSFFLLFHFLI